MLLSTLFFRKVKNYEINVERTKKESTLFPIYFIHIRVYECFCIIYNSVSFKWNSYYNEIMQIMPGVLFILGMVCAEISGFLTISERNCVIEEKERIWTEKERIEIEKLLLKLDD